MNIAIKTSFFATLLAAIGVAAPASAVRVQANSGSAYPKIPTAAIPGPNCFNNAYAMVSNVGGEVGIPNCNASSLRWIVPVEVHNTGSPAISVSAFARGGGITSGSGANSVSCTAIAVSTSNAGTAGPTKTTSGSVSVKTLDLTPFGDPLTPNGTIEVPSDGTLAVECKLSPSIQFNIGLISVKTNNS